MAGHSISAPVVSLAPYGPLFPGAVRQTQDATGQKVYVQFQIGLFVAFPDGTPVVQTLEELKTNVADTLEAFKSTSSDSAPALMTGPAAG